MTDDATLRGAFAMRAAAYAHIFDVLREEFGEARAAELLRRAIRRMGEAMGRRFAGFAPQDLAGLCEAFLGSIPRRDDMFAPEVPRLDGECLEIHFRRCPLKEAWIAAGRSDRDVARLCEIAGAIDSGLFTAAGFAFANTTWRPGETGCCRLRIEPGPARSDHTARGAAAAHQGD